MSHGDSRNWEINTIFADLWAAIPHASKVGCHSSVLYIRGKKCKRYLLPLKALTGLLNHVMRMRDSHWLSPSWRGFVVNTSHIVAEWVTFFVSLSRIFYNKHWRKAWLLPSKQVKLRNDQGKTQTEAKECYRSVQHAMPTFKPSEHCWTKWVWFHQRCYHFCELVRK